MSSQVAKHTSMPPACPLGEPLSVTRAHSEPYRQCISNVDEVEYWTPGPYNCQLGVSSYRATLITHCSMLLIKHMKRGPWYFIEYIKLNASNQVYLHARTVQLYKFALILDIKRNMREQSTPYFLCITSL